MIRNISAFCRGYMRGRSLGKRFDTRAEFEAWQKAQVDTWLHRHARQAPAYLNLSAEGGLDALPVLDKAALMAQFDRYNAGRISRVDADRANQEACRIRGWSAHAGIGTSRQESLYLLSDYERFHRTGSLLGKLFPDFLAMRKKIVVVRPAIPASFSLPDSFRMGRMDIRCFDMAGGPASWADGIFAFDPEVIVAPPRVLRWIAEWNNERLRPERLVSGGEILSADDRDLISAKLGPVEEIYWADEGLLATSCEHGQLHLSEDSIHFELEAAGDLVSPIITDFTRRSQIMPRYRMDDLLKVSDSRCPCGSLFRVVDRIAGRRDDIFLFPSDEGTARVTPDVLDDTVAEAGDSLEDYRLHQISGEEVVLYVMPGVPEEVRSKVTYALEAKIHEYGARIKVTSAIASLQFDASEKLRRIRSEWSS